MPMVEVRTLGRFEIYVDDQLVSTQIGRSKKLKHLAEYLILNHDRAVPNDEPTCCMMRESMVAWGICSGESPT